MHSADPDRLKNVIVSVIFAKKIFLKFRDVIVIRGFFFPQEVLHSRESIRLGLRNVIVILIIRKLILSKTK